MRNVVTTERDGRYPGAIRNYNTSPNFSRAYAKHWRTFSVSNEDVVMETGIDNLTEDQVSFLVHFGPETTQT